MQITRASDYAVRVMIHLATVPAGAKAQRAELSRAADVPGHFLSKVLQQLVRSHLIRSQRGSGGGFVLAVPPSDVSLLDVVEAIEGPVRLNLCIEEGPSCERKTCCPAHEVWVDAQSAVVKVLAAASIASLAEKVRNCESSTYVGHDSSVRISSVPNADQAKRVYARDGH